MVGHLSQVGTARRQPHRLDPIRAGQGLSAGRNCSDSPSFGSQVSCWISNGTQVRRAVGVSDLEKTEFQFPVC